MEWRGLYQRERDVLTKYYERKYKMGAGWFFNIWIAMGWIMVAGVFGNCIYMIITETAKLIILFMLPFMIAIPYFFFVFLGHKMRDDWSKRELSAIRKNKAVICETSLIETETRIVDLDSGNRVNCYAKVMIPDNDEPVSVHISGHTYEKIAPGDTIFVLSYYEPKHHEMMFGFTEYWMQIVDENIGG